METAENLSFPGLQIVHHWRIILASIRRIKYKRVNRVRFPIKSKINLSKYNLCKFS